MSKKLTEDELDAKFEEFMQKLSTDEETSLSVSITKENKKDETKDTLWWLKDDKADDNQPGASKPNLFSWLKSSTKTLSSAKTSKADLKQTVESVANVLDKKEPSGYQSDISEQDNSVLTTEPSKVKTNSPSVDSQSSQLLKGGEDYGEDFESGKSDTRTSNKWTEAHGDAKSENEQLSTLNDLTLNSGGSNAQSPSAKEKPSQYDQDSDESATGHQSVREESLKSPEKDISKHSLSENISTSHIIKQSEEAKRFGQDTFIIKANPRGIEEILNEAEEIERSNSQVSSHFSHPKEVVRTTSIEKSLSNLEYPEPRKSENEKGLVLLTNNQNFQVASVDNLKLQQLLKEERRRYAELQVEVSTQENGSKQRLESQRILYEERLLHLEAENVHLSAKIDELRQKNAKDNKKADADDDGLVMDKTNKLHKEFKEQEHLITGYQRENEQLYDQLKNLKNELKRIRTDYSEETQRLLSELATIKRNSKQGNVDERERTFFSSVRDEMQLKIDALLQEIDFLKEQNTNVSQKQFVANNMCDNTKSNPRGKSPEVTDLKTKILHLENEIRKKNLEQSSVATVLAAKETRILSLEKQVKQLEQLVSVRHPNSISALVLAAGAAEGTERQHRTVQFLEDRVCELEEKLSSQNTDENSSLKRIHEQYVRVKEHYEARISQLEKQKGVAKSATTRPQSSITALEKELDSIRERHRKETEKMKNEIIALRQEIKHKAVNHRSDDQGLALKVRYMANELTSKDKQIKILQQKLDELKSSPFPSLTKSNLSRQTQPIADEAGEKDIKEENRMLKAKVQQLIEQVEYLRGTLQETRQKSECVQEDWGIIKKLEDGIAAKRMELGEVYGRLRRANEGMSEMRCRNEIQELVVTQLRERLAIVQVDSEQIKRLRAENAELRLQCHEFRERLVMAEAAHPPEWKHYAMLQSRVNEVEKKYRDKSNELQAMAEHYGRNLVNAEPNENALQAEVNQWKALAEKRNREIEGFRDQIDEIIVALESLYAEVHGKRKAR